MPVPAGDGLPAGDPFGVSVSLPAWTDTVSWAQRDPAFMAQLKTGYPRFFIPRIVEHLSRLILQYAESLNLLPKTQGIIERQTSATASSAYSALLLINTEAAVLFCSYLLRCGFASHQTYLLDFNGHLSVIDGHEQKKLITSGDLGICVVAFPTEAAAEGKSYWQHTGLGISSRCATYWIQNGPLRDSKWVTVKMPVYLPLGEANEAYERLRSRIADMATEPGAEVRKDDVFLFPTGMAAIESTASIIQSMQLIQTPDDNVRVVIFGFLYVDTYKVLSKIRGYDCVLYGHASSSDLDRLEADLANGMEIRALYTEFPGNPLMASPDLQQLQSLSGRYGFTLIVDDTIGTSVNVSLISYCDILCTSLTKMFSGGCNVMGGSIALSPRSARYRQLKREFLGQPTCPYFCHDVLMMEKNSNDFPDRVAKASSNAEHIATILSRHTLVDKVYYPKGSPSQPIYDRHRKPGQGYGFLISIQFKMSQHAVAFHDAFNVAKGPSLGTNFTLCCAYTLLAHYKELEWAAEFGVTEHLVRISVGIEDLNQLEMIVGIALQAAEKTQPLREPLEDLNGAALLSPSL